MSDEKKRWRDVYAVHAAANFFPMLPQDELKELGKDILMTGLREPIALWSEEPGGDPMVLDGRNRLDAMELAGMDTVELIGNAYRLKVAVSYLSRGKNFRFPSTGGIDPYLYGISKNIHRRHLTQQ